MRSVTFLLFLSFRIFSVNGLALDRPPKSSVGGEHPSLSNSDLSVHAPFLPAPNMTHARRFPPLLGHTNAGPIAIVKSRPNSTNFRRTPSDTDAPNTAATPRPTGRPSSSTTVHITDEKDFALLLPKTPRGEFPLLLLSLPSYGPITQSTLSF